MALEYILEDAIAKGLNPARKQIPVKRPGATKNCIEGFVWHAGKATAQGIVNHVHLSCVRPAVLC